MIAYKFLRAGGVGPFSRFAWPLPARRRRRPVGRAADSAVPCRSAVHACRVRPAVVAARRAVGGRVRRRPTAGRHKIMAPRRGCCTGSTPGTPRARSASPTPAPGALATTRSTALDGAGAPDAAAALRHCEAIGDIRDAARAMEPPERARIAVTMAGDAAVRALGGAAVVTAYIAAHAATGVDGGEAWRPSGVAVGLAARRAAARRLRHARPRRRPAEHAASVRPSGGQCLDVAAARREIACTALGAPPRGARAARAR